MKLNQPRCGQNLDLQFTIHDSGQVRSGQVTGLAAEPVLVQFLAPVSLEHPRAATVVLFLPRLDLSCQNSGRIRGSTQQIKDRWKIVSLFLARDSKSIFTSSSNTVKPTAVAFSIGASKLYCAFQTGSIYVLDFIRNKYCLLAQVGQVVTAICVHNLHDQLYVALSDRTLRILDEASGDEVAILNGHTTSVLSIFIQPRNGKYALSTGFNEAILWNLETRRHRCKLNIETGVTLASAFFIPPDGDQIMSCFRDGSLYVWNTETLDCVYSLASRTHPHAGYRTFTFTSEGCYMFAAGRSAFVDVWRLHDGNANNTVRNEAEMKHDPSLDHCLFERIQMPCTSIMIRTLLWIPRSSLPDAESTRATNPEELSGYLMVLGNDHRVRLLTRKNQRQHYLHNHLSFSTHIPNAAADDTDKAKASDVAWICLFTLGTGFSEDPPISDIVSPKPTVLQTGDLKMNAAMPTPGGNSLVALIDIHGVVHVVDVVAAIKHFHKPAPLVIKVQDAIRQTEPKCLQKPCTNSKFNGKIKFGHCTTILNQSSTQDIDSKHDFEDPTGGLLDRRRLRLLLKEFGHFPDKYRLFIWRAVLQLPNNTQAFNTLLSKGLHPAYETLPTNYPIRGQKLMRVLQKVCSCLAFWSPLFGETDWLPLFIFPFIKLFQNNVMHAFEVVATVLMNWCATWFEYFPNPPINILCMIENLLAHVDPELYHHLVKYNVTTEVYAWPLLQTAFSEVFTQNEWLLLWDTLLCHSPGLMLATVVAYSICARGPLLSVCDVETFETFFRGQNSMSILAVVDRAHQIMTSVPPDLQPDRLLANLSHASASAAKSVSVNSTVRFQPLTAPQYPIVTRYPKFIVDFHIRERERIREEEKEYLKQRATVEDMQRRAQLVASEEESWYRQQALLLDAEERRRTLLAQEETKLREQRKRLSALIREVKLQELTLAEESHTRSRQLDIRRRKAELDKMEEQLLQLANKRTDEMDAASHAVELARLQQALQQRRAETMALMMMTRETQPLDTVNECDPIVKIPSEIKRTEVNDNSSSTNKRACGIKETSDKLVPVRQCSSTPADLCQPDVVVESQTMQSQDNNPLITSRASTPQTFVGPTMKQFIFTSTKLPQEAKEMKDLSLNWRSTGYDRDRLTEKPSKLDSGDTVNDSGDSDSIEVSCNSMEDSTRPVSIGELTRENQNLIAEVESLLNRIKSQKISEKRSLSTTHNVSPYGSLPT